MKVNRGCGVTLIVKRGQDQGGLACIWAKSHLLPDPRTLRVRWRGASSTRRASSLRRAGWQWVFGLLGGPETCLSRCDCKRLMVDPCACHEANGITNWNCPPKANNRCNHPRWPVGSLATLARKLILTRQMQTPLGGWAGVPFFCVFPQKADVHPPSGLTPHRFSLGPAWDFHTA